MRPYYVPFICYLFVRLLIVGKNVTRTTELAPFEDLFVPEDTLALDQSVTLGFRVTCGC